ncbi:iron-sulfur cluster assembly scaffold protein [Capsulimonas corticalis]|nr:iron-sulfur cluster assembly scaffold protein [Capsulimonas corticalis]
MAVVIDVEDVSGVLNAEDINIIALHFQTYGCPAARACGEFVSDYLTGKPLSAAIHLSEEDFLREIGRMPLGREHCPGMTIRALRLAVASARANEEDSL